MLSERSPGTADGRPAGELRSSPQMRLPIRGAPGRAKPDAAYRSFRFATVTLNQPNNAEFIFGPSVWPRNLSSPSRLRARVHRDWRAEVAIVVALSGDERMIRLTHPATPILPFLSRPEPCPRTRRAVAQARARCVQNGGARRQLRNGGTRLSEAVSGSPSSKPASSCASTGRRFRASGGGPRTVRDRRCAT